MLLQVAFAALVAIAVADQCGDCPGFCTCISTNVITPMQANADLMAKVDKVKGAFKECANDKMMGKAKIAFKCIEEQFGCSGEEACKEVFEFLCDESEMEEKRRRRRGADGEMEKMKGKMKEFAKEHKEFFTCVGEKSGMSEDELEALHGELKPLHDAGKECMMGKCYNNDKEAAMRFFRKAHKCVKKAFHEAE